MIVKNETVARISLLEFLERIDTNSQLTIPVYQRHYVWKSDKHIKRILEDYESLLNGEKNNHFMGIIMYSRITSGLSSEFLIIDGQQRITTFFLMLHALKNIAEKNNDWESVNRINGIILTRDGSQKLKPLKLENDVYAKIVTGDNLSIEDKKSNIYINYQTILKFFDKEFNKNSVSELIECFSKFDLVSIALEDNDKPQEIFETINSAGRELTKSDLIRNYILMELPSEQQEEIYINYWLKIEKLFERTPEKLELFFRYFLANKRKELPDMEYVYDVFRDWFDDRKKELGNKNLCVNDIIKEIYEYSQYYYILYLCDKKYLKELVKVEYIDKNICKSIVEFHQIGYDVPAPILIEIFHLYKENSVSSNAFSRIINLFITYYVRRNLVNQAPGTITREVPIMLRNILSDCNGNYEKIDDVTIRRLVDSNSNKKSFLPNDKYMEDNMLNADAYSLRKYVKLAFEKIESKDNPAVIDFDETKLSIEHLLPQTPTQEWLQKTGIESIEEYNNYLHRLGNLTLTTQRDNSKMSNNPFDYKKQILEGTGHIKMNMEIINKDNRNIDDINDRTKKLIKEICIVYPYETVGEGNINKYDIFFKNNDSQISAYLYDNQSVEILEGSYFKLEGISRDQFIDLINDGVLSENSGRYIFNENFQAPDFIELSKKITGNKDAWQGWTDAKNIEISFNIKTHILNKISSIR